MGQTILLYPCDPNCIVQNSGLSNLLQRFKLTLVGFQRPASGFGPSSIEHLIEALDKTVGWPNLIPQKLPVFFDPCIAWLLFR